MTDPAPSGTGAPAVPPAPEVARSVFGAGLADAERYVARLATDGVTRGLIGPREVPRLWERHVLNSAAVADAVPRDARVVDVGSGAGLPGIPLALARPDLRLTLVEPMARRVEFLEEVVAELGMPWRVVRGRAEERDRLPDRLVELGSLVTGRRAATSSRARQGRWPRPAFRLVHVPPLRFCGLDRRCVPSGTGERPAGRRTR